MRCTMKRLHNNLSVFTHSGHGPGGVCVKQWEIAHHNSQSLFTSPLHYTSYYRSLDLAQGACAVQWLPLRTWSSSRSDVRRLTSRSLSMSSSPSQISMKCGHYYEFCYQCVLLKLMKIEKGERFSTITDSRCSNILDHIGFTIQIWSCK